MFSSICGIVDGNFTVQCILFVRWPLHLSVLQAPGSDLFTTPSSHPILLLQFLLAIYTRSLEFSTFAATRPFLSALVLCLFPVKTECQEMSDSEDDLDDDEDEDEVNLSHFFFFFLYFYMWPCFYLSAYVRAYVCMCVCVSLMF